VYRTSGAQSAPAAILGTGQVGEVAVPPARPSGGRRPGIGRPGDHGATGPASTMRTLRPGNPLSDGARSMISASRPLWEKPRRRRPGVAVKTRLGHLLLHPSLDDPPARAASTRSPVATLGSGPPVRAEARLQHFDLQRAQLGVFRAITVPADSRRFGKLARADRRRYRIVSLTGAVAMRPRRRVTTGTFSPTSSLAR